MHNPLTICTHKGHISANMSICPLIIMRMLLEHLWKTPWRKCFWHVSSVLESVISLLVRALCGFSNSTQMMSLPIVLSSVCQPFPVTTADIRFLDHTVISCLENNWFIASWSNTAFWMGTVVGRFQQIINYTQTSQRDLCTHFNQHCAHLFAFSFSAEQTLVSSELCSCCKGQ